MGKKTPTKGANFWGKALLVVIGLLFIIYLWWLAVIGGLIVLGYYLQKRGLTKRTTILMWTGIAVLGLGIASVGVKTVPRNALTTEKATVSKAKSSSKEDSSGKDTAADQSSTALTDQAGLKQLAENTFNEQKQKPEFEKAQSVGLAFTDDQAKAVDTLTVTVSDDLAKRPVKELQNYFHLGLLVADAVKPVKQIVVKDMNNDVLLSGAATDANGVDKRPAERVSQNSASSQAQAEPAVSQSQQTTAAPAADAGQNTVYVTPTGKRYFHNPHANGLNRAKKIIPMTEQAAIAAGYTENVKHE